MRERHRDGKRREMKMVVVMRMTTRLALDCLRERERVAVRVGD